VVRFITGPMSVDEGIRFDDVRTMIFRRLGLLDRRHFVSISAQYNTGGASAYYFCLIPIRDEIEWRMIFQMAQLTAKMIAWAIKRDLAGDMNCTIKGICAILREKFSDVTPSYSKIWRGREKAVAQIFKSWEDSYGTLPQLFNAIQSTNPRMKYTILSKPAINQNIINLNVRHTRR
jgi:hypothetical protein